MRTNPTRREVVFMGACGALNLLAGCRILQGSSGLLIRQYPDPLLRQVSVPVESFDTNVVNLCTGMVELLKLKSTIDFFSRGDLHRGLAAPQVGVLQRIIVCALRTRVEIMINPEITDRDGTYISGERCLSLKGHEEIEVTRSETLQVRYIGFNEKVVTLSLKGRDAALLQHEVDHLNGVLFIDHAQKG